MKHYHYVVSGFMYENPDGSFLDYASIEVFAQTEEEAISEAEKLIEKKHYRVSSVITHDDTICPK